MFGGGVTWDSQLPFHPSSAKTSSALRLLTS